MHIFPFHYPFAFVHQYQDNSSFLSKSALLSQQVDAILKGFANTFDVLSGLKQVFDGLFMVFVGWSIAPEMLETIVLSYHNNHGFVWSPPAI